MKRQIQIIIFILTLPMVGLCQKKFSVGANVNSQISILTIKDSNAPSGINEKAGLGIGYSLGLQAQYNINEKLFLRSGIQYQNRINRHKIGGLRYPSGIASIQNDITIISMGIPFDFGYSIKSKNEKMNYVIGLGGVINVPVDTKTEAKVLHEQMEVKKLTQAENIVDESVYYRWNFWRNGNL
jgi:hypothetical protein